MILNEDVIEFFDSLADTWDEHMVIDDDIVKIIMDAAGVCEGKRILDVACGTGVLLPYYLEREVSNVTGIDISSKMIEIAQGKYDRDNVRFICNDAMSFDDKEIYDCAIIYNAFPHFSDPDRLIENLCRHLDEGGTLTVAHGMSRDKINEHHGNVMNVSALLPDIDEMKALFEKHLTVTRIISDGKMYLVTGVKKES